MPAGWTTSATAQPIPPQNGTVYAPHLRGCLDIRWDDPRILAGNSKFTVVGVNVYRSDTSDRGPYYRINDFPLGGTFYRDRTDIAVVRETVLWDSDWLFRGDAPNDYRWVLKTKKPIYQPRFTDLQEPIHANWAGDVTLIIDNVTVPVQEVFGPSGEITLFRTDKFDVATEKTDHPVLPTENSVVEVIYYSLRNQVSLGLSTNLFYRLTTVVLDPSTGGYLETDLAYSPPVMTAEIETLDYIWREAVRRNAWILQQGGERVKAFIRKVAGIPCTCGMDPRLRDFNKQPSNSCRVCLGTGFVGGYEGPFDIIIAPPDAEQKISQTPLGRRQDWTYEVWSGPSPVLTQRDFLVKQTNERFSIGPVRRPTNRGNLLQQHFSISAMTESDIRYEVPIYGIDLLNWPETRYDQRSVTPPRAVDGELTGPTWMADPTAAPYPVGPDPVVPMHTDKPDWPAEKQPRGRTPVWGNQNT